MYQKTFKSLFFVGLVAALGLTVLVPGEVLAQSASCQATGVSVVGSGGVGYTTGTKYTIKPTYSGCSSTTPVQYCISVSPGVLTESCINDPASGFEQRTFTAAGNYTISAYVKTYAGTVFSFNTFKQNIQVNSVNAAGGSVGGGGEGGPATGPQTPTGTTGGQLGTGLPQGSSPNAVVGNFGLMTKFGSLGEFAVGIINYVIGIIGVLSLLFIIIGGVRMVTSAGNESAITAGKKTVTWAVIGLVVALLAFTIIAALEALLGRQ